MKRYVALSVACALLVACQDQPSPTTARPLAQIRDGAHAGNTHFWFLPPMVPPPSFVGVFNPGIKPVVQICALIGTVCGATIATFTTTTGPGSETVRLVGNQYVVNWHTAQFNLSDLITYRILVLASDDTLGFADVDVVTTGNQLKNVNTQQFVPLLDDRTLPIRFRIELGAFGTNCVRDCAEASVTNGGGIVVTNTGFAGASFPAGWLPVGFENVLVTIERVTLDGGQCIPLSRPQAEGCYRFKTFPDVGNFAGETLVTVGICVDIEHVAQHDAAQLFKVEELVGEGGGISLGAVTALENAPATFVSCSGFASAAPAPGLGAGVARALRRVGTWLAPSSAYAAHVGAGGLTGSFSRIGWMLPTTINFDSTQGSEPEPIASGTPINDTYSSVVRFTRLGTEGGGCGDGTNVYATNGDGSLATNAVSACSGSPAFSADNDGVIRADFNAGVSKVCIDVTPGDAGSTGFLSASDGEITLRTVTSAPGVAQVLCVESAGPGAPPIFSVRFAGSGATPVIFDNLSFTDAPFSD